MSARLWCLRHAESENVVTRTSGAVPHAELTPRGRDQAAEAGRRLRGAGITHVYASSAVRAATTAEIVAGTLGLTTTLLPELAEVGLGRAEGSQDAGVRARTAEVLRAWVVDGALDEAVADGEDGHAVTGRVAAALAGIAARHDGGVVAVVGHVASLTAGLAVLCGLGGLGGRVWGAPLPHAEPFAVEGDGTAWHCGSWPAECLM